ncbi:hypothetical protein FQZ97_823480 [compost metagenome]
MQLHALAQELVGELDDEDAVLGDQADEGDHPHLGVDIQGAAEEGQCEQRAGHGQRHAEEDDQRVDEALELRGQHQVDEHQGQGEDQRHAAAGVLEVPRGAGVVELGIRREHRTGRLLQIIQGLAQGVAGADVGGDRHRAQLVEMVELPRRHGFPHFDQVGQLHHAVVAAAHIDAVEVVGVAAVDVGQLHQHVVLLAVLLEAGHLAAAEQAFQATADGGDVGAHGHRLFAVDRDLQLRRVELEVAVQALQCRIVAHPFHQLVDVGLQLAVLQRRADHEVHRLVAGALPKRRPVDGEGTHAGDVTQFGQEFVANLELAALAGVPGLEFEE